MPDPKGKLVTPVAMTAAEVLQAFLCDSEGRLEVILAMQTTAKARMYLAGAQDIPNVTWTKVALDTDSFDPSNITDLVNHRIVAAVAGYYTVTGAIEYPSGEVVADKATWSALRRNGTAIVTRPHHTSHVYTIGNSTTDTIHLDIGQYMELWTYHTFGAAAGLTAASASTFLSIHLLSAD